MYGLHDIYESYERDLRDYEESFKPHPGQVGFIAAIDGKIIGCDISSQPRGIFAGTLRDCAGEELRRARRIFVSLARETGYTLTDLRGILREKFQCYLAWQPLAKRQGERRCCKG